MLTPSLPPLPPPPLSRFSTTQGGGAADASNGGGSSARAAAALDFFGDIKPTAAAAGSGKRKRRRTRDGDDVDGNGQKGKSGSEASQLKKKRNSRASDSDSDDASSDDDDGSDDDDDDGDGDDDGDDGDGMSPETRLAQHVEKISLYRKSKRIYVKGSDIPDPIVTFDDLESLGAPAKLIETVNVLYSTPTPIQVQAAPVMLADRELFGIVRFFFFWGFRSSFGGLQRVAGEGGLRRGFPPPTNPAYRGFSLILFLVLSFY